MDEGPSLGPQPLIRRVRPLIKQARPPISRPTMPLIRRSMPSISLPVVRICYSLVAEPIASFGESMDAWAPHPWKIMENHGHNNYGIF